GPMDFGEPPCRRGWNKIVERQHDISRSVVMAVLCLCADFAPARREGKSAGSIAAGFAGQRGTVAGMRGFTAASARVNPLRESRYSRIGRSALAHRFRGAATDRRTGATGDIVAARAAATRTGSGQTQLSCGVEAPGWREIPYAKAHPSMHNVWLTFGPEAMYWAPKFVRALWGAKEIFITENGCASDAARAADGISYGTHRINVPRQHIAPVCR